MFTCIEPTVVLARDRFGLVSTPPPGLALATAAAERLLDRATLGMLLMHQFGYHARDGVACFAEGALGGSGGVCHADGEFVEAALNAARVTQ